jgi:hypothetical protein
MKKLIIEPNGWQCTLEECPMGHFVYQNELCFKTDHNSNTRAYNPKGDNFRRTDIMVQPVVAKWIYPKREIKYDDVKVLPNGIISGCVVTAHRDPYTINISEGLVRINNMEIPVVEHVMTLSRPTLKYYRVSSISATGTGRILASHGQENKECYNALRAKPGGPPVAAANGVELCCVKMTRKANDDERIYQSDILTDPRYYREEV